MQTRGFGLDDCQEGVTLAVGKFMVVVEDLGCRPNRRDPVQQFLFRHVARTHPLSSCEKLAVAPHDYSSDIRGFVYLTASTDVRNWTLFDSEN
jgi:hypothetical protein